jgi:hypothetical protein
MDSLARVGVVATGISSSPIAVRLSSTFQPDEIKAGSNSGCTPHRQEDTQRRWGATGPPLLRELPIR